jgi:glutathione synthase
MNQIIGNLVKKLVELLDWYSDTCAFRTRQVDDFTSRLLDIHRKMMDANKEEVIRLSFTIELISTWMIIDPSSLLVNVLVNAITVRY